MNMPSENADPVVSMEQGLTESERYLSKLANKTFLSLWCYPNLFSSPGKELCDLLVVCGDDILIFSDKFITWPDTIDVDTAWARWYKRAIDKSAAQVRGAARWIEQFPNRIYLDAACSKEFPLKLPTVETRRVHGILVARGAGKACQSYFGGGSGSLRIVSSLRGKDHIDVKSPFYELFTIGDVNPDGAFMHVLEDTTLDIILNELDTITDFVLYLNRKSKFLRSSVSVFSAGEEEMLAEYLRRADARGDHDFLHPDGIDWKTGDVVSYAEGLYEGFIGDLRYKIKKDADKNSYIWDSLIEAFNGPLIAGTTIIPEGTILVLNDHERALRYLALENRTMRRAHGEAIIGAIEISRKSDRFFRAMLPVETDLERQTGFFVLLLRYPTDLGISYERYREVRRNMLEAYALAVMDRHRNLKRIVGIALDSPKRPGEALGSSEDLILFEPDEWTADLSTECERLCSAYNILREGNYRPYQKHIDEYPLSKLPGKSED